MVAIERVRVESPAPPRIRSVVPWTITLGDDAIELAELAGLYLDEWQKCALRDWMSLDPNTLRWLHFETALNVARQNGKGAVLEARELAGLFLTGERLLVHSAHEFKTSQEHFRRVEHLVQNTPELDRQVKRTGTGRVVGYRHSHGEESIELQNGTRLMFVTRTKSGLRGFAGVDFMAMDEAMILNSFSHGTMMPTLRASTTKRGQQLAYAGSAADQMIHEHSLVWSRIRQRGIRGGDPDLAYIEYSVPVDHPLEVSDSMAIDRDMWAMANPGLGIRITEEHMAIEQRALDARSFAVELLGAGDYPDPDDVAQSLIPYETWLELEDEHAEMLDPVCLAFDVSPDRRSSIVAVGLDHHGRFLLELIECRAGTAWVAPRLEALYRNHEVVEIVCDGYGPSGSIATAVDSAGIKVERLNTVEHGQACGLLVDAVAEGTIRHLGQEQLTGAVRGAKPRPLGDTWAWSRKSSTVDISPLVAATLAHWSAQRAELGTTGVTIF